MTTPNNIETASTTIQDFFDEKEIEEAARDTKFVQRYSPLGGFIFLQAVIFAFIDDPEANLDDWPVQTLGLKLVPKALTSGSTPTPLSS
ncbi:MAG: hypothetical protein GY927_23535 [bacterium]|nr:hypothetical protein [bacterium]